MRESRLKTMQSSRKVRTFRPCGCISRSAIALALILIQLFFSGNVVNPWSSILKYGRRTSAQVSPMLSVLKVSKQHREHQSPIIRTEKVQNGTEEEQADARALTIDSRISRRAILSGLSIFLSTSPSLLTATSTSASFSDVDAGTTGSAGAGYVKAKQSEFIGTLKNYQYSTEWTGTALDVFSPMEAAIYADNAKTFPFARWPDPVLRRQASTVPSSFPTTKLRTLAYTLRRTARENGAVGLAAQQCGIDASLVFLEETQRRKNRQDDGIFLVNPRIIKRSSEVNMRVWNEECLVLPPSFSATVLRDDTVIVEYETLDRETRSITLRGELARAAQHEMDHDRGILILDHIGLEEMESDDMRRIETEAHTERMELAFSRSVTTPTSTMTALASNIDFSIDHHSSSPSDFFSVPPANAAESITINNQQEQPPGVLKQTVSDEELAERNRIIQQRRAMMKQSKTTTSRQDMFNLSQQRAKLIYNTTYKGANCPPGSLPCY